MFEKVNPSHPDKVADRIAGALVDLAYRKSQNPKIAAEVLIGHGECNVIIETNEIFTESEVKRIVDRIAGDVELNLKVVNQDPKLAKNQIDKIRCGDNGIFKGVQTNFEEVFLKGVAKEIYKKYPYDGKYIYDGNEIIICQSNAKKSELEKICPGAIINPLGDWTGGIDTDCGATNRKLGSDMGRAITGGGLHGKDLSKADVSVNIYAFLRAKEIKRDVEISCAIGDDTVDGVPYSQIVNVARDYIESVGGFERFAEWGLV